MKKLLFLIILILSAYGLYLIYINYFNIGQVAAPAKATVRIGDTIYTVELADTENKRAQGLSGKKSLAENQGMLFLFDNKDRYAFWMKGMLIPLDFIWIDGTTIVDLTENVPAPLTQTYTPAFSPKLPVDKILEVNTGEIKKRGFTIGQEVSITLLNPQNFP